MKSLKIVVIFALFGVYSSATVPTNEALKRSARSVRSSMRHTLCDLDYGYKQILVDPGTNISQAPAMQEHRPGLSYVICKLDAEFGEGTVRNVSILILVIVSLVIMGCVKNIWF